MPAALTCRAERAGDSRPARTDDSVQIPGLPLVGPHFRTAGNRRSYFQLKRIAELGKLFLPKWPDLTDAESSRSGLAFNCIGTRIGQTEDAAPPHRNQLNPAHPASRRTKGTRRPIRNLDGF